MAASRKRPCSQSIEEPRETQRQRMTSEYNRGIPSALILPFQATDCHFILQAVIRAIHEAIQKLPNDIDFSNPTLFAKLPFPSTLRILAQQFEWSKQDNISYFQYMGRSKFNDIL